MITWGQRNTEIGGVSAEPQLAPYCWEHRRAKLEQQAQLGAEQARGKEAMSAPILLLNTLGSQKA